MFDHTPSLESARQLDAVDPLRSKRDGFHLPSTDGVPDVYFVGNSLGLQPHRTREYLDRELDQWRTLGVHGHFEGAIPWMEYQDQVAPTMAELIGARRDEVVVMNTLTVNLHLMMATFYQPTTSRGKILIEHHAFPSDHQAVASHLRLRGQDPEDALVLVTPEQGQWRISTELVCETIRRHRDELALVLLPGVQYYTGQVFDMRAIAAAARELEIPIGFDLAHAAGNVPTAMHDWGVDFACWCTYKYLNSGPGALSGCFIHERHATNKTAPRLAGWWGHDRTTLFEMKPEFDPMPTAEGWQLSNPPILSLAAIRASMDVFREAGGLEPLREKALAQGRFFRDALNARLGERVRIITPAEPEASGCQLSLEVHLTDRSGNDVHHQLRDAGMHTDWREPNVIRAAPTPLYNSFEDIWRFVDTLAACTEAEPTR